MATLTEVSFFARRGIKWGALGLVILMMIPFAWAGIKKIYLQLHPPPPPPPTIRYGKLPQLVWPQKDPQPKPSYKLETISGGLPADLPNVGRVYVVQINKSRLLTIDRYRATAKLLGFTNEPVDVDEQTIRFFHPTLPAELTMNIISGSLAYKLDWTADKNIYTSHHVPLAANSIAEARAYLQTLGLLQTDLGGGTGKYLYLMATGSAMIQLEPYQADQANFVRVDLYRADKDNLKFVTAGGDTSPVSVIISALEGTKRIAQANYHYSQTLDNDFATYPLKGVAQAWQELQNGTGYIAKQAGENVTVRKISLGYYESGEPQDFLQPAYVFEGDNGYIAYVQAALADYVTAEKK